MDTIPLPTLFISHGSPMTALEPREAGAFMKALGPAIADRFGRPRAIVVASAHSTAREPVLLAGARHQAVYDFGGFSPELYTLRYDAPGAPALAAEVQTLLAASGIQAHSLPQGGLDHGIWTPLRYMYPEADLPVLPLAFVPSQSPAQQFALGEALASLSRQGVLVMGTGSITHNLRMVFAGGQPPAIDAPEIAESKAFRDWVVARSSERDWAALLDYRRQAPHAALMHPTDEHWLPWYVAAGAGGREHAPQRIHASLTFGCLGMDAYAFGPGAGRLQGLG
ncbi:DODA-type extradiol aromatic ring-opening family dioxygenase [Roseateles toxinivorans]|uniref:4,5-DOPA dioxygenase extradiol n=1 Tax=Roseateles toxinivorans TaxID=270368 RepID=A0A4R6QN43_9BURK|nr:class III extradiol ring-cleavage dioxygenase [Roseateles toxinivorans]TDP71586.1 4,5-DOPA dioxygenase extradiol [Roseateles toxinivorans]